jgi:hypothetical protein
VYLKAQIPKILKSLPVLLFLLIIFSLFNLSCDEYKELGGGYEYAFESKVDVFIFHIKEEGYYERLIPCTILDYADNKQFIVAAQKPYTDCLPQAMREDALNTGNDINFWIADKEKAITYGPLSYDEYLKKRRELGVPSDLKMDLRI